MQVKPERGSDGHFETARLSPILIQAHRGKAEDGGGQLSSDEMAKGTEQDSQKRPQARLAGTKVLPV
jgi:hypothetical protein